MTTQTPTTERAAPRKVTWRCPSCRAATFEPLPRPVAFTSDAGDVEETRAPRYRCLCGWEFAGPGDLLRETYEGSERTVRQPTA